MNILVLPALLVTPVYLGHLAHCTNYAALCVIHVAHCVVRGCPSLLYVGAPLRTLFTLVGVRRTRARESRFSFLPSSSGTPTSALYRARNLVLLAPHRGPDPGMCSSYSNRGYTENRLKETGSPDKSKKTGTGTMCGNSQVYAESDGGIEMNGNIEVREAVEPPLSDGFAVRNGTSVDTSHLT